MARPQIELPGGWVAPADGISFGADVPGDDFAAAEQVIGRPLDWHRRHTGQGWDTTTGVFPWASSSALTAYKADIAAGAIPVIVLAATGGSHVPVCTAGGSFSDTRIVDGAQGFDRIAAHEWDVKIVASLDAVLEAVGDHPVAWVVFQEPNIPAMGGYHGYQAKPGETKADGIARYQRGASHVAALIKATSPTWWTVWAPTLFVPKGDTQQDALDTYWGSDLIGFDAYRGNSPLAGTCDWVYDFAVSHGKPVVVAEWGDYPASAPSNLGKALAAMKTTRYQAIVAFWAWAITGISDNRFDASQATAAAWRSFAGDTFTKNRPAAAPTPTPTPVEVPQVGVIFFENASRSTALKQPTFAALAKAGVDHQAHEGTSKPSLPDYMATIRGGYDFSQGHFGGSPIGKDGVFKVGQSTAENLLTQLQAAGHSWKAYEEGADGPNGYTAWGKAGTGSRHVARHCPAAFFAATDHPGGNHGDGRYDFDELRHDITGSCLPDFFWCSPDLVNCGHDQGLAPADAWLAGKRTGFPGVKALLAAMRPGGILILSFDNVPTVDTSAPVTGTGVVYLVVLGQAVQPAKDTSATNHFGLLRAIQQRFGLPALTSGVDAHYTNAKPVTLPATI